MVAELLDRRQQFRLDFRILHLVLYVQTAHYRLCLQPSLLQLQLPSMRRVRTPHRDSRVPDGVYIYQENLQVSRILIISGQGCSRTDDGLVLPRLIDRASECASW